MRALDQRAKTILKVSSEIVRQQDAFFVQGVQHLRPLNLKTVADAISMHESTVSRVTANKYMATQPRHLRAEIFLHLVDRGGRRRRSAFGGSRASPHPQLIEAESAARRAVRRHHRRDARGAGIDIARRTVAKYREAMRIPSSVQRRRDKLAAG